MQEKIDVFCLLVMRDKCGNFFEKLILVQVGVLIMKIFFGLVILIQIS